MVIINSIKALVMLEIVFFRRTAPLRSGGIKGGFCHSEELATKNLVYHLRFFTAFRMTTTKYQVQKSLISIFLFLIFGNRMGKFSENHKLQFLLN
jgi:hypothetical protein